MARATLADLDKIENALQALNAPPQVTIETRFLEFEPGGAAENILLPLMATNKARSVMTISQLMSDPQFKAVIDALENQPKGPVNSVKDKDESPVVTGILTARQAARALNKLKKAEGVTILAAPRVTTLSGRVAQVSVSEVSTEPGLSVGVLATVGPDGKAVSLSADVEIPADAKRNLTQVKAGAKARLWDGQTLVIQPVEQNGRTLIILVTPTVIDPAGNRVNPIDSIPDGIPPQTEK
jgi:hypothetical protein